MSMKIKAWSVTVSGYGDARYYAAPRGNALAAAWSCDAGSETAERGAEMRGALPHLTALYPQGEL